MHIENLLLITVNSLFLFRKAVYYIARRIYIYTMYSRKPVIRRLRHFFTLCFFQRLMEETKKLRAYV